MTERKSSVEISSEEDTSGFGSGEARGVSSFFGVSIARGDCGETEYADRVGFVKKDALVGVGDTGDTAGTGDALGTGGLGFGLEEKSAGRLMFADGTTTCAGTANDAGDERVFFAACFSRSISIGDFIDTVLIGAAA